MKVPCGGHEFLHLLDYLLDVSGAEFELVYVNHTVLHLSIDDVEMAKPHIRAVSAEVRDGCSGEVEFLEALGAGKVEKEAFFFRIQVGYPFGFDNVAAEPMDFDVGEGVVEAEKATHGLGGIEGKDAKDFLLL